MPLYAGVCETNITPPPDVWMGGYIGRGRAMGIHDELYARALVLDNGQTRIALLTADLAAFPEWQAAVRETIAAEIGTVPQAVMLHSSHTHGGPYVYPYRGMGEQDEAYNALLMRKLTGAARQAAANLQPAHLTYGESSAQIGINRRATQPDGNVKIGHNYGGPVSPLVQVMCVNSADGRTFALLFSHACHPTTMVWDNRLLTADWPGAAVARLKERFRVESADTGIAADALPFFLQGCCGDINPMRRGTWPDAQSNGNIIADAAHTARWNAHGRMDDTLDYAEMTVQLPLVPPPSWEACEQEINASLEVMQQTLPDDPEDTRGLAAQGRMEWGKAAQLIHHSPDFEFVQPFTIQKLTLGGATLLGFPAEMFVQYQLDFTAQSSAPLFCLGFTNGCWGYVPTDAEHARGGYEVDGAHKYYGTLAFAPGCEPLIHHAVQTLLNLKES